MIPRSKELGAFHMFAVAPLPTGCETTLKVGVRELSEIEVCRQLVVSPRSHVPSRESLSPFHRSARTTCLMADAHGNFQGYFIIEHMGTSPDVSLVW